MSERFDLHEHPVDVHVETHERDSWIDISPEDFTEAAKSLVLLADERQKPLRLTIQTGYFISARDLMGRTGAFPDADIYIPTRSIGASSWEKPLNDLSQGVVDPVAIMFRVSKIGRDLTFNLDDVEHELAMIHGSKKIIRTIFPPADHPLNEIVKQIDFRPESSLSFIEALKKFRVSYTLMTHWFKMLSLYKLRQIHTILAENSTLWDRSSRGMSILLSLSPFEASLWEEAFNAIGSEAKKSVYVTMENPFVSDVYFESVTRLIQSGKPVIDEVIAHTVVEQWIDELFENDIKALSVPTWQRLRYSHALASRFSLEDIELLYSKLVANPHDEKHTILDALYLKGIAIAKSKQALRRFAGIEKSEWRDPEDLPFISGVKEKGKDWWNNYRRRTITYEKENVASRYLKDLGLSWSDLAGKRVLDIGAASGGFVKVARAKGVDAIALDKNPEDHLRSFGGGKKLEKGIPYLKADAWNLPFADHSFDMVVSRALFHHIIKDHQDIPRWLDEVKRVLRPGGQCRISFGTPGNMLDWGYGFFSDEQLAAIPADELHYHGGQEELVDRIAVSLSQLFSTYDPTAALIREKDSVGDREQNQRYVFVVKNLA